MKHLDMIFKSCDGCPFLQEDDNSVWNGIGLWYCTHPNCPASTTIVITSEDFWEHPEEHMIKAKYPSGFPYWCPLENVMKGGSL